MSLCCLLNPYIPLAWCPTSNDGVTRLGTLVQDRHAFDLKAARAKYDNGMAYAAIYWSGSWKSTYLEVAEGEQEQIIYDDPH